MKILLLITVCWMLVGCAGAGRSTENPSSGVSSDATDPAVSSAVESKPVKTAAGALKPIPFAPTYQATPEEQYAEARRIYDSSPAAAQGVYRHDTLVYVIVVIDTNQEKIKYLEGTAMLRSVALLRRKYPQLPPQFRVRNRVVENELDDETGIYRYALVYRSTDIEKAFGKKSGE